jgi:hypothetical protein
MLPPLDGNNKTSTATIRVRFAFAFSKTLPRVTACLPYSISEEKKLIEFGDLDIFRL